MFIFFSNSERTEYRKRERKKEALKIKQNLFEKKKKRVASVESLILALCASARVCVRERMVQN